MDKFVRLPPKVPTTDNLTKVESGSSKDDSGPWLSLLDGDAAVFERVMLTNYRTLFYYGLKFTADQEFVKDTIQDLFLHVWERRASLSADIPPKPYLMASLRRMMNRSPLKSPLIPESLPPIYPPMHRIEFSVEKEFIQHESARALSAQLKTLLDDLSLRQKEVVYLKFYEDLSRPQIAMVMDIAPQTVSNLLQMALKKLRKYWEQEFETPLD